MPCNAAPTGARRPPRGRDIAGESRTARSRAAPSERAGGLFHRRPDADVPPGRPPQGSATGGKSDNARVSEFRDVRNPLPASGASDAPAVPSPGTGRTRVNVSVIVYRLYDVGYEIHLDRRRRPAGLERARAAAPGARRGADHPHPEPAGHGGARHRDGRDRRRAARGRVLGARSSTSAWSRCAPGSRRRRTCRGASSPPSAPRVSAAPGWAAAVRPRARAAARAHRAGHRAARRGAGDRGLRRLPREPSRGRRRRAPRRPTPCATRTSRGCWSASRGRSRPRPAASCCRQRFSYFEDDLAVLTWNAALVVEPVAEDTDVQYVLEFANAQLLELRFYDALLDAELPEDLHPRSPRRGAASTCSGRGFSRLLADAADAGRRRHRAGRARRELAQGHRRRVPGAHLRGGARDLPRRAPGGAASTASSRSCATATAC